MESKFEELTESLGVTPEKTKIAYEGLKQQLNLDKIFTRDMAKELQRISDETTKVQSQRFIQIVKKLESTNKTGFLEVFDTLKINEDGKASLNETASKLKIKFPSATSEEIRIIFNCFHPDQDNLINSSNLQEFLKEFTAAKRVFYFSINSIAINTSRNECFNKKTKERSSFLY